MKNLIMSLASVALCMPLYAQVRNPVQNYGSTYSANERTCAGTRVERKDVNGGRKMEFTLHEPSDVSIYSISVPSQEFMDFYEKEIIGWLKKYDTKCDYNVYLLGGRFLVVVSSTLDPPPWESGADAIPNLAHYIQRVDVKTLTKPHTSKAKT